MKRCNVVTVFIVATTFRVFAGDFQDFLTNLNTNWIARNYTGIRQAIDDRLAVKTNDLPALIAKADYYTTIELDMSVVSSVVATIKVVTNGLDWSVDEEAGIILDEMNYSAENRSETEQSGYIFGLSSNEIEQLRQEFPTNHPATVFLPRYAIVQYGSDD